MHGERATYLRGDQLGDVLYLRIARLDFPRATLPADAGEHRQNRNTPGRGEWMSGQMRKVPSEIVISVAGMGVGNGRQADQEGSGNESGTVGRFAWLQGVLSSSHARQPVNDSEVAS